MFSLGPGRTAYHALTGIVHSIVTWNILFWLGLDFFHADPCNLRV